MASDFYLGSPPNPDDWLRCKYSYQKDDVLGMYPDCKECDPCWRDDWMKSIRRINEAIEKEK